MSAPPTLAKSAQRFAQRGVAFEFMAGFMPNVYSNQNPDGLINLGIAENSLMQEHLKEYLPKNFTLKDVDFSYGDHPLGSTRLFGTLAKFFNKYFKPLVPVEQDHLITGNGVGSIIEQLTVILCEPGDCVLVAQPYYSGFDEDMTVRALAEVIGVEVDEEDPGAYSTVDAFEHEIERLKQAGKTPRVVILCNPNNPLGFNYTRETILAYCRLCEKHNLHLVSDEIYALSQFRHPDVDPASVVPFTSILSIDVLKEANCNPARVHVLYGMSKDFGANGLRIGVFISQYNRDVRLAFFGIGLFSMKVSSISDSLWSALLNDEVALDSFIRTNQQRLGEAFETWLNFFRKHNIPVRGHPTAALFIWIDLNRFRRDKNDEGKVLATDAQKDDDLRDSFIRGGIYINPGYTYHGKPGWFRVTFSLRPEMLEVALQRFDGIIQRWSS